MNDQNFNQVSKEICDAIGMLEHSGLIDYNGHVSCRMADSQIETMLWGLSLMPFSRGVLPQAHALKADNIAST